MDRKQTLDYVKQKGMKLRNVAEKYRDDKEIVMASLGRDSWGLKYVSKRLKEDPEVVLKAISRNSKIRPSKKLFSDKTFVLQALQANVHTLKHASPSIKSDRDVLKLAVKLNGHTLQYASEDLKDDRDIVSTACRNVGTALAYSSQRLRSDRDIVLLAVQHSRDDLEWWSRPRDKPKNGHLSNTIQSQQDSALLHASRDLQNDREIVLEALKTNGYSIRAASAEFRSDKSFVLKAAERVGQSICCADGPLRDDPDIVGAALSSDFALVVIVRAGADIRRRLRAVLEHLLESNIPPATFLDKPGSSKRGSAAVHHAEHELKRPCFEIIWLIQQHMEPLDIGKDPLRMIGECLGLGQRIKFANELIYLAPVLSAISGAGGNFRSVLGAFEQIPF